MKQNQSRSRKGHFHCPLSTPPSTMSNSSIFVDKVDEVFGQGIMQFGGFFVGEIDVGLPYKSLFVEDHSTTQVIPKTRVVPEHAEHHLY